MAFKGKTKTVKRERGETMKIEWCRQETVFILLEAEDEKESLWLTRFFEEDCKKIAVKFPRKEKPENEKE